MVAALFPQVILVRNTERLLYAKNHNLGMRISRARYACHLDSDTLLTSNALAAMVGFMEEHPEVAACGPKLLNGDGSVQHCIRGFTGAGTFVLQALNWHKLFPQSRVMNRYYNTDFDYSRAQQVQSIGTSAYIVRRSTWEQVGMFDERFGQFMGRPRLQLHAQPAWLSRLVHAMWGSYPLRKPKHPSGSRGRITR